MLPLHNLQWQAAHHLPWLRSPALRYVVTVGTVCATVR